jgi:IS1 family transposase
VRGLDITYVELDELHSFVHTREKNLRPGAPAEHGEQWLWCAIARACKLIVSYAIGKRDADNARALVADLRARLVTVPVICSDALQHYLAAVGDAFVHAPIPASVDFAQIVKKFTKKGRAAARSPQGPFVSKRVICGAPNLEEAGTSYVERENLTFRTQMRRLVRRGSGHSKKLEHHTAAIDCFVGFYNLCRPHMALRVTPAMEAGLTDHVWSPEEFITTCLAEPEGERPAPCPLKPRDEPKGGAQKVTKTGLVLRAVPRPSPTGKGPSVTKTPGAPNPPTPKPVLTGLPTQLSLFE